MLPELVFAPRLTLRRWRPHDAARLGRAIEASIEHLRPWMSWIKHEPMTVADREQLLRSWDEDWVSGGDAAYCVLLGDVVVGSCGLHYRGAPEVLEIGYWLHGDHLGKGYARELARALTTAGLAVPGISRVEIRHDLANIRSRAVPEALGFQFDGQEARDPVAPAEIGIQVTWSTTTETWPRPQPS